MSSIIKKLDFRFDESNLSADVRFEKDVSPEYKEHYQLRADLKSALGEEIFMKISFDSGWSSSAGRLATRMGGTIFNQICKLSPILFPLFADKLGKYIKCPHFSRFS